MKKHTTLRKLDFLQLNCIVFNFWVGVGFEIVLLFTLNLMEIPLFVGNEVKIAPKNIILTNECEKY